MKTRGLSCCALLFISAVIALGDAAPILVAQSGTVKPIQATDIVLKEETIDIHLYPEKYSVTVNYTFVNTGPDQEVVMGFPNREGDYLATIEDFKAFDQDKRLQVFRRYDLDNQENGEKECYECFRVSFTKGEHKKIKNTYSQIYQENGGESSELILRATYILRTGALWRDKIGSIKARIFFHQIPPEEFQDRVCFFNEGDIKKGGVVRPGIRLRPVTYKRYDDRVEMEFSNIDPDFDLEIDLPRPLIHSFKASSEMLPKGKITYEASNVYDNDLSTAWVEGAPGPGTGSSLTLDLAPYIGNYTSGACAVAKIGLVNGYAKSKEIFLANNRIKKARMTYYYAFTDEEREFTSERISQDINLKDTMDMQYLVFSKPALMSYLTFTILDVYKGDKYDDTCISEIRIYPATRKALSK